MAQRLAIMLRTVSEAPRPPEYQGLSARLKRGVAASGGAIDCFNPRAPRGARPALYRDDASGQTFQSTRPARGATAGRSFGHLRLGVSIHAPREGRDSVGTSRSSRERNVSIHAPREGRDLNQQVDYWSARGFNPRAPRGARHAETLIEHRADGVSIHAPREGRDNRAEEFLARKHVSIHAPREGRDPPVGGHGRIGLPFQSTRPARGATKKMTTITFTDAVSIHAPREGRDQRMLAPEWFSEVSIHAPREGRDILVFAVLRQIEVMFQSTRPARGATIAHRKAKEGAGAVSIHAPREGATGARPSCPKA